MQAGRRPPVVLEEGGVTVDLRPEALADDQLDPRLRQSFVQLGIRAALHPMLRPQRLRAIAWVQAVVATPACADLSSTSKASAGVRHPSVLRGRLLSVAATAARVAALCDRSITARSARSERRRLPFIATPSAMMLRRPLEF